MPLTTYQEFLELSGKQLTDYLSVRAWLEHFWGGDKWNWLLAFSKPNESQSNLLQRNYEKKSKELGIPDPTTVRENAVDDVTKWLQAQLS